jgi:hypothetical protein
MYRILLTLPHNRPSLISTVFLATVFTSAISEEAASKPQPLKCDVGPIDKTYGKTQWLVYSCDDKRSFVIVSAPGNPAMPIYFIFYPHENGCRLEGEGTGRKDSTKAAFDELKALSGTDIAILIEQTRLK